MELLPETYGQAHQMTITPGPDVNAEELGHWYSPARVAILIEAERESCANDCELQAVGHRDGFGNHCAAIIRDGSNAGLCPYCGKEPELVSGLVVYPHRADLRGKSFYRCAPCDAYVGCHPGTTNALGRLANTELRVAKMAAHAAFDPLWKSGAQKRGSAYAWLCGQLQIEKKNCHIGMFDVETCRRVVEVCRGA